MTEFQLNLAFGYITFGSVLVLLLVKTDPCSPIKEIFSGIIALHAAILVGWSLPALILRHPYTLIVATILLASLATLITVLRKHFETAEWRYRESESDRRLRRKMLRDLRNEAAKKRVHP